MTVLADFQTIIGDREQAIADTRHDPLYDQNLGMPFDTGGRIGGEGEVGVGAAFLIYAVRSVSQAADVFVNGKGPVGRIQPTEPQLQPGEKARAPVGWTTQMITMGGSRLVSGQNTISVRDVADPFFIKNLICFYHQDSD